MYYYHLKEMEKEEFKVELFSKKYVKIKDPRTIMNQFSKDNLTDFDT